MNYNLIYDPISKKYKDIYSKSGKLIIKKYLDYLIGGTSQDDIPLNTYKSLKELLAVFAICEPIKNIRD